MAGGGSNMKKSCGCCKRYLEHLGGKMSCFLRRMTPDSMHSMIMPNRFVNHFGGKIPGTIKLQSPNGILYVVEVTESMNKTVLQCGWEAFVDAHHIKENDSLLFRHIGNSCFEVLILGSDGCEKVFSCAGINKKSSCIRDKTADPVDTSGSPPDDTSQPSRSGSSARCQRDKFNDHRNIANFTAMPSSSCEESEEDVSLKSNRNGSGSDESQESEDSGGPADPPYIISFKDRLSPSQKKMVKEEVRSIQSKVPVYVAIMKKTNVGLTSSRCQLELGARYAAAVRLPDSRQSVVLQRRGERWPAAMEAKSASGRRFLVGGWHRFARDNRLRVGDVCLFELRRKQQQGKLTMAVHVIFAASTSSRFNLISVFFEPIDHDDIYAAAAHLPDSHNHQTVVLQREGKTWKINMVVRRNCSKRRWFLAAGWRRFVHRDNRLRVGDLCLFELKKKKQQLLLTMELHIIFSVQ
ncbi:LOW QUALITY PROTEIN: B3 domain-containing protein Os03g0619800-like [Oryza brachyantha]|uniref:LOW QUALITY PROTEIN: B3 domain-containing protein Os03g0619800-like n=1 Tax=Oryza brachyantha TaxID=4533 RepID=UPI0007761CB9|nr:LOW QUALITY PROTEIN: B3 domain-containing protein Os03g0619800-like [Oryza brachyantha]